jgi:hypothetical protein
MASYKFPEEWDKFEKDALEWYAKNEAHEQKIKSRQNSGEAFSISIEDLECLNNDLRKVHDLYLAGKIDTILYKEMVHHIWKCFLEDFRMADNMVSFSKSGP